MGKCSVCGQKAGLMMNMCDACINQGKETTPEQKKQMELQEREVARDLQNPDWGGTLLVIGLGVLAYGLYNLFYPVSGEVKSILQIASLHKLFIGLTMTIVGTMLSLAGAKPKNII